MDVDISSEQHYAHAFDWRGLALTWKVSPFQNRLEGYQHFKKWVAEVSRTPRRKTWYS